MKFKVSSNKVAEDEGILYVLLIKLEDRDLVKIGITGRAKILDRVLEISAGIFAGYRYLPYIYPKRFRKTSNKTEKEARLHKYFEEYKYITEHPFGGHTEMFDIGLDIVVEAYEIIIKGEELPTEKYEDTSKHEEC